MQTQPKQFSNLARPCRKMKNKREGDITQCEVLGSIPSTAINKHPCSNQNLHYLYFKSINEILLKLGYCLLSLLNAHRVLSGLLFKKGTPPTTFQFC